jgi:hypothetical protein
MRELRIPYVFAVAPMKERLYRRFLPDGLALHPTVPTRQVNAILRSMNGGEAINLLPALREGRHTGRMFPRTDSGWSDRGAFFAYRDLMQEAGKRVIDLSEPLLPGEARFTARAGFRGDLAGKPKVALVDDEFVEVEGNGPWEEEIDVADLSGLHSIRMPAPGHLDVTQGRAPHLYEKPDDTVSPRGLLVGDASCLALIPWLAEHFRRFVFLWTPELPFEAIELEKPDVLIHVISERLLVRGQ